MFKWLKRQRDYMRKTGGLEEKRAATKQKLDVANRILERRMRAEPVEIDRRAPRMSMTDAELLRQ